MVDLLAKERTCLMRLMRVCYHCERPVNTAIFMGVDGCGCAHHNNPECPYEKAREWHDAFTCTPVIQCDVIKGFLKSQYPNENAVSVLQNFLMNNYPRLLRMTHQQPKIEELSLAERKAILVVMGICHLCESEIEGGWTGVHECGCCFHCEGKCPGEKVGQEHGAECSDTFQFSTLRGYAKINHGNEDIVDIFQKYLEKNCPNVIAIIFRLERQKMRREMQLTSQIEELTLRSVQHDMRHQYTIEKIHQKLAESNNSDSSYEQVSSPSVAPLSPDIEVFYPTDLNIIRCIEKGAQGSVVLASTEFYQRVAVKYFSQQMKNWSTCGGREMINLLRVANHPNLVQTRGIVYPSEKSRNENQLPTGFVMEYMTDGSLYSVIHDKNISYDEKDVLSWTQQAASALSFLHKRDLLHRDVKPGNMLLGDGRKLLKLCDLGLSVAMRTDMTAGVGTFVYMAPEVMNLNGGSNYDKKCDVYSLSCSIWEMVYRKTPFLDFRGSFLTFCENVCGPNGNRPILDESCQPELAKVIERGWSAEPETRPTMQEIHSIVKKELERIGDNEKEDDLELMKEK